MRGFSRRPARPGERDEWATGDANDPQAIRRAMDGCQAALFLVHQMGSGADFHAREVAAARIFADAAGASGLRRVVYLGGMIPRGQASEHLQSRREVGEALRAGPVPCVELRASMIVGEGSLSWLIVRDLAARLPVMVLPAWLRSRTQPVAIDDVVVALVAALDLPLEASAIFDLPGPETMSGREILDRTAQVMRLHPAWRVEVPFLSPRLSSLWVRFVTRARWAVARQVVVGLGHDLLSDGQPLWPVVGHQRLLSFDEAARQALGVEAQHPPAGAWVAIERWRRQTARAAR